MEKNRIRQVKMGNNSRMTYSRQKDVLEMPNLIEVQTNSYKWFLEEGLKEVFRDISDGAVGEFVIAKESVSDNAYFDPETGYIVIGADALENGINVARKGVQSWFQSALHEAAHGTEKTVAWFALNNQLRGLEGGKVYNEMLKQLGNRGYFNGKAADIRAEVEKIIRKVERGEALTDKQTALANVIASEGTSIMAELALGNEHFARELLDADASIVEKLLNRIAEVKEALAP